VKSFYFSINFSDIIVQKGINADYDSYSAFQDDGNKKTELDELLRMKNVKKIFICGLALGFVFINSL
jgi:nicotinamidase-related amidase